jgi:hypothetical protein
MSLKVAFTSSGYRLQARYGMDAAQKLVDKWVHKPAPDSEGFVFTLYWCRQLFPNTSALIDYSSHPITHERTRGFHAAYDSECDVWVSCDSDLEASRWTVRQLVTAVAEDPQTPSIVIAPYRLRKKEGEPVYGSYGADPHALHRVSPSGIKLLPIEASGMGLVAFNRAALKAVYENPITPKFKAENGELRPAVFAQLIGDGVHGEEGVWYGEDLSLFHRNNKIVRCEALVEAHTRHDGMDFISTPDGGEVFYSAPRQAFPGSVMPPAASEETWSK